MRTSIEKDLYISLSEVFPLHEFIDCSILCLCYRSVKSHMLTVDWKIISVTFIKRKQFHLTNEVVLLQFVSVHWTIVYAFKKFNFLALLSIIPDWGSYFTYWSSNYKVRNLNGGIWREHTIAFAIVTSH